MKQKAEAEAEADAKKDAEVEAPSAYSNPGVGAVDDGTDQHNLGSTNLTKNHTEEKDKGLRTIEEHEAGEDGKNDESTDGPLNSPQFLDSIDSERFDDTSTHLPTREDTPFPADRSARSTFVPQLHLEEAQEPSVLSPELGRKCITELPDMEDDVMFGDFDSWKQQDAIRSSSPLRFDFRSRTNSQEGEENFEVEDDQEDFEVDESSYSQPEPPSPVLSKSLPSARIVLPQSEFPGGLPKAGKSDA